MHTIISRQTVCTVCEIACNHACECVCVCVFVSAVINAPLETQCQIIKIDASIQRSEVCVCVCVCVCACVYVCVVCLCYFCWRDLIKCNHADYINCEVYNHLFFFFPFTFFKTLPWSHLLVHSRRSFSISHNLRSSDTLWVETMLRAKMTC